MDATVMATRKAADSATRSAPSILSTGRLSAFRPASHRTSRDIRRVTPPTLTFTLIAPQLPDVTSRAQQRARSPLPAGIAVRGRYGRTGDGRGIGGPGPGLVEGISLRTPGRHIATGLADVPPGSRAADDGQEPRCEARQYPGLFDTRITPQTGYGGLRRPWT